METQSSVKYISNPASEFERATWIRRLINNYLDDFFINIYVAILAVLIGLFLLSIKTITRLDLLVSLPKDNLLLDIIIGFIFVFPYYLLSEYWWSKTPAKFITRTKVVMLDGSKPDFKHIFVRTLYRFIPFEPLSFLGSKRPNGWHDRGSNTMVIENKRKTNLQTNT